MAIRKFKVRIETEVEINVDESVINQVNDDWREMFYYDIDTPCKVVEHLAYNIILFDRKLSDLDGFANLPNTAVMIYGMNKEINDPNWEIEATEITEEIK